MKKILIIRLTSLGDVIFTVPLACALKDGIKDCEIGWVVAEKGLDVVKNNPCVDKVHFIPLKEWKKRPFSLKTFKEFFQIVKEIRKEKYQIALDCQQMFKSLLLFMFSGAKRRITFKDARELSFLGGNEFIKPKAKFGSFNYHIVERNLDFARHLGITSPHVRFSLPEVSAQAKAEADEMLKDTDKTKPSAVIAPATTWANKHWAEENWAVLLDGIGEKFNIIFTGTEADKALVSRILEKTSTGFSYTNLTGKTDLQTLREIFTRAKVVISPDSGSAHLAWATQIPSVIAIFTCTPAKRFGPYDNHETKSGRKYFSISGQRENTRCGTETASELICSPCFKKKCKLKNPAKGENICQKYPKPEEIINIVNKLS